MWRFNACTILLACLCTVSAAQERKPVELLTLYHGCLASPYEQQIQCISTLLQEWRQSRYPLDSSYVDMMLKRAKAKSYTSDLSGAINDIKQILQLYYEARPNLKTEHQLEAYYRLGFNYRDLHDYKRARSALEQGVALGSRVKSCRWTGYTHNVLAFIMSAVGEYQQALQVAEQGMFHAKASDDLTGLLENWSEKIRVFIRLEQYDFANREVTQAVALARGYPDGKEALALLLSLQAQVKASLLDKSGAINSLEEALSINNSIGYENGLVINCLDLGYYCYLFKQYHEAELYANKALSKTTDEYVRLRILNNLGAVYWKRGQYQRALQTYQDGLSAVFAGSFKNDLAKLPKAEVIQASLYKEFILALIQDKADTWLDYAKATNNRQYLHHALETYQVADQMIDYMRWEHSGEQSKLYWRHKTRGIYERAVETCYLLQDAPQAFRFLEKSRSVMLADKLNELGARRHLSVDQVNQEKELRTTVAERQAKLATVSPKDQDTYRLAVRELSEGQRKLNEFLKELEKTNTAYYRYKYDNTTTSLAELQTHLKAQNASFVSYFVGDSALYVLSVTGDKAKLIHQAGNGFGFAPTTQQFLALLSTPGALNRSVQFKQFIASGYKLYQQLLAPLHLSKGPVIVSLDGAFLPFDALSQSASQRKFAIADYAFSYVYSAHLMLKEGPAKAPLMANVQGGDFLGIAPVQFAANLKQNTLNKSDEVLQDIGERFGSHTLLTHQKATRGAFRTMAPNYRIIQLFTHADANSSDREPTLYFADSTLRLSELGDGVLPRTQLAVLTACKTGIGADQRGEGVFSLARGFAALGVPSVVSTLWSVEDNVTYELTKLFYANLDEGLPKDVALQKAKQQLMESENLLPSQWAGLILIGDARPLDRPNPWVWAASLSLIAAGSLASSRLARRRRKTSKLTVDAA